MLSPPPPVIHNSRYIEFELSLFVFCVICNDISVIYVTAQKCRRTEEEVYGMR